MTYTIDPKTGLPALEDGLVWNVHLSGADLDTKVVTVSIAKVSEETETVLEVEEVTGFFGRKKTVPVKVEKPVQRISNLFSAGMADTKEFVTDRSGRLSDEDSAEVERLMGDGWTYMYGGFASSVRVLYKTWENTTENVFKAACQVTEMYKADAVRQAELAKRDALLGLYPPKSMNLTRN